MKLNLFFLFTLFLVLTSNAQIDSDNKSIAIPAVEAEDPKEDNELIIQPIEKNNIEPEEAEENKIVLPKKEVLPAYPTC